jgi:sec-independent protein translocase protein TatC
MLQGYEEYLPYLKELRKRIFGVLILFIIVGILGIIFSDKIITFFLKFFNFSGVNIVMTNPAQLIDLSIYTGIICGLVITLPVLIYEIISFAKPAFKKTEYKLIKTLLPIGIVLFVLGTVFGAWITQFVVVIYSEFSKNFNISNIWDIQTFFSQVIVTALCMGVVFEMPIILTILMRTKIVKRSYLAKKRRWVYAATIIFALLMPPTDILSLTLLTVPLWFLFEIALLLNKD